jgi:hypothetical protein
MDTVIERKKTSPEAFTSLPTHHWFMSLVGNCNFNYFAAQMTTHETV